MILSDFNVYIHKFSVRKLYHSGMLYRIKKYYFKITRSILASTELYYVLNRG